MEYATFSKVMFSDNWQVTFIGGFDDCQSEKENALAQGVQAVVSQIHNVKLWDIVEGGKYAPIQDVWGDYSYNVLWSDYIA